jgi:hypothetical protein
LRAVAPAVGRELSVVEYIDETSFTRGNNTHIFWPYASQAPPEDVYRFLGTTDVTALAEAVKAITPVRGRVVGEHDLLCPDYVRWCWSC